MAGCRRKHLRKPLHGRRAPRPGVRSSSNLFAARLSGMGALQVVRQLGSNAHDQALAMRVTSNGVVVLVGYTPVCCPRKPVKAATTRSSSDSAISERALRPPIVFLGQSRTGKRGYDEVSSRRSRQ